MDKDESSNYLIAQKQKEDPRKKKKKSHIIQTQENKIKGEK